MLTFFAIALGTFASEDLTCVATGLLIQRGQMGVTQGILACTLGIFVGDVGLWAVGRLFGTAALAWPWTARRLQHHTLRDVRAWLDRHAAGAIVGSRFLPGTRFALYVMSGVLRGADCGVLPVGADRGAAVDADDCAVERDARRRF